MNKNFPEQGYTKERTFATDACPVPPRLLEATEGYNPNALYIWSDGDTCFRARDNELWGKPAVNNPSPNWSSK